MGINSDLFGKRVHLARKRCGMTQQELSETLHVSMTYISQIENGKKLPSLEIFISITNALRSSADELLIDSLENPARGGLCLPEGIFEGCTESERVKLLNVLFAAKELLQTREA